MSIYTRKATDTLPEVNMPEGLRIEASADVELLSVMGATTVHDVTGRLAAGHIAFVAFVDNTPASFGWMAREKAKIGELNHELVLPRGNRYLWNFRTLEAFRGMGIYPALLQYIMQYEKADRFWIIHAPENKASLKGIRKAGFQYVGKLYSSGEDTVIESTEPANRNKELLQKMGIRISWSTPASCWNCSSPHLKKRNAECCCSASSQPCTGNGLHAPALQGRYDTLLIGVRGLMTGLHRLFLGLQSPLQWFGLAFVLVKLAQYLEL